MSSYTHFIGMDIGKFDVVVALHGQKTTHTFSNTTEGFETFIKTFSVDFSQTFVVLETTGGYEKLFLESLEKANIPVHRADTRKAKFFIKSLGKMGKSDAIDAQSLATYGVECHKSLPLYQKMNPNLEVLQSMAERRLDLNQLLVQEKNRLQAPALHPLVKESCKTMIQAIQTQIDTMSKDMKTLLAQVPELEEKQKELMTIPGVGEITSMQLCILVPELGHLNRRAIASLAGLAPHPYESGTKVGYRRTKGGRQSVKSILFMAGLAAAHSKSKLGVKYKKMIESGKKKMVAIVALMRHIIVIANAKIKDFLHTKEDVVVENCEICA